MAPTTIVAFWVIAVLLIVVPGPDWGFTLGATLRGQPVIAAVAGLVMGYAVLTAVVSAGVGALITGTPAALTAFTLAGALNPKALLLFLALLRQFTTPHSGWPLAAQIALLGSVFTVTCAVFYALLGTFARTVRHAHPSTAGALSGLSGTEMLIIGLLLIAERIAQ